MQDGTVQQVSQGGSDALNALLKEKSTPKSQDVEDVISEQPDGQDEITTNEQPLDEPTYELSTEEYSKLQELDYTDEDLDSLTREQVDEILTKGEKKPEQTKKEEPEIIVTPQMAEKLGGIAKSFVNKPVTELFKTIERNNAYIERLQTENKKANEILLNNEKKKIDELNKELTTTNDLTEEQFNKKVEELVELRTQVRLKEAQVSTMTEQQEQQAYSALQAQLPEGLDAKQVFTEWGSSLTPDQKILYSDPKNSVLMFQAIVNYGYLQHSKSELSKKDKELEEAKKNSEKKVRIETGRKVTDAIRKANSKSVKGSHFSVVERTAKDKYDGMDSVAADILRHANE